MGVQSVLEFVLFSAVLAYLLYQAYKFYLLEYAQEPPTYRTAPQPRSATTQRDLSIPLPAATIGCDIKSLTPSDCSTITPTPRAFTPSPAARKQTEPSPNASAGERLCADICRQLYPGERAYYNYRDPQIVNYDTQCPLELDIFYPERQLAVEFNGRQHYEQTDFGSPAPQNARDLIKASKAYELGICLVTVPWTYLRSPEKIKAMISRASPPKALLQ